MSYQDLSEIERARVRRLFYNPETSREKRIELLTLMQNSADEVKVRRQCPRCKHYPFFVPHDEALIEGHVYSEGGLAELPITGYCEFCFDLITEEPDEEDEDAWKQRVITEDLKVLADSMGSDTVVSRLSDEEVQRLFAEREEP